MQTSKEALVKIEMQLDKLVDKQKALEESLGEFAAKTIQDIKVEQEAGQKRFN